MHINKIRLVNFRGMEDLTVEFAPGMNVIIGDNGAGKSSLLNGICVALGNLFSPNFIYDDIRAYRQINEEDVRVTSISAGNTTEIIDKHFPVKIEADLIIFNGQEIYEVIKENSLSSSITMNDALKNKMREAISNPARKLPLLNFQSADRRFIPKTQNEEVIKIKNPERKHGYRDAFSGTSNFSEILDWCTQMDYSEYKLKHEVQEYKNFKAIISKFMKKITEKENLRVDYAAPVGQLMFYDGENGESLNILSAGYQNVLNMIMDFAHRAVLLNPTMDNFDKIEGVVIIDEIDMHLHPKWQWKILDALRSTFPSVQFIVATHSPMIISSAEDARLLLMSSPNEVEPLENAYGINVDNVLELRQQSADMPPELKKLRKQIIKFLNNNDIESAQNVIKEAEREQDKNSALINRLKDFFDMNKWIVEA